MSEPRDWIEDFTHENGNYQSKCSVCGELFMGHKRRFVCKVCATTSKGTTMSEAPDRVWIDNDDLLKVSQYSHHSDCCICLSIDSDDSQDTEFIRADIAEKAKKDAVREVLEKVKNAELMRIDTNNPILTNYIDNLLNEVNK